MKIKFTILSIAVAACAALTSHAQSGGPFDLKWSTIDSGGGTSRGGQFSLSGTIGQPDPGTLAANQFKLEGGFWSGVSVVQTAGAPLLKIKLSGGGQAVLSWPVSATGFVLEETPSVGPLSVWSATPQAVMDTATEHTVTVPAAGVMKCYRLKHP